jgi:hypothetical protein
MNINWNTKLKNININFVSKVDVYTFQLCAPVSVLSILVPGPARHYSAVVPRCTTRHDFAPGRVVLVPSSRHGGTTGHGTTVPPCLIVSCRVVSCPCRVVPAPWPSIASVGRWVYVYCMAALCSTCGLNTSMRGSNSTYPMVRK